MPSASRATPPHPGLGELGVPTRVDPALEGLLPGVALSAVGSDRLELPLKAFQGRETGSGFRCHTAIVMEGVPVRWHRAKRISLGTYTAGLKEEVCQY